MRIGYVQHLIMLHPLLVSRLIKMEEKKSEEAERIIERRHDRYFKHRVQRLIELGEVAGTVRLGEVSTVTYNAGEAPPPHYLQSYIEEAEDSYLGGNFRSCIFCCAAAVEQVIRYELIKSSGNTKAEIKEVEGLTLGKLIKKLKCCTLENEKISHFKKISDNLLNWVNKARNAIAVHPPHASVYDKDDTEEMKIWKNERMIRYIKRILGLLNDHDRERMLDLNVESPEGGSTTLRELLSDPKSQHIPDVWYEFTRRDVFPQYLALETYRKMKEIIEGVYPC